MPLLTVFSDAPEVRSALKERALDALAVATARSWDGVLRIVRERPTTGVVLDSGALPPEVAGEAAVAELRRRFPSLALVFIARAQVAPLELLRLGRAGIQSLVLIPLDAMSPAELRSAVWGAMGTSASSLVTRAISPHIPSRELRSVRLALEGVQRGWSAEDLSSAVGLTRAHASVRLRACGLPSAGHVLTWAKLLHAGHWLTDPGRTAQSISRQLEYSTGAAFRRALRSYTSMTPGQVRARGGLFPVLTSFLDSCGLPHTLQRDRSVA